MTQQRVDDFLNSFDLEYGPTDQINDLIVLACDRLSRLSDTSSLYFKRITFAELLEVNKRESGDPDSWFPVTTSFRMKEGGFGEDDGVAIAVCDAAAGDRIVVTQCGRVYDWPDTNFATEAESMRMFYHNPAIQRQPNERCDVNPRAGLHEVCGRVGYFGGLWVDPQYRRLGVTRIMAPMLRTATYSVHDCDYISSLMTPNHYENRWHTKIGYDEDDAFQDAIQLWHTVSKPEGCLSMVSLYMRTGKQVTKAIDLLKQWRSM